MLSGTEYTVVRRMPLSRGVQDSTGAAFAEEARTRQGADVQLPADIEPDNYLESDRSVGSRRPHLLSSPNIA